jgi:hypothetical protein
MSLTVYARFSPERLVLRLCGSGARFDDTPEVAIDTRSLEVLAVGAEARSLGQPGAHVEIVNGFGPARTVIGDVDAAEIALRHALYEVLCVRAGWARHFLLRPELILHPLSIPEGGLTQFEVRGLEQLGRAAGGRNTYVWVGHKLSDQEIRAGAFRPRRLRA